jgi:hypothetical protein
MTKTKIKIMVRSKNQVKQETDNGHFFWFTHQVRLLPLRIARSIAWSPPGADTLVLSRPFVVAPSNLQLMTTTMMMMCVTTMTTRLVDAVVVVDSAVAAA